MKSNYNLFILIAHHPDRPPPSFYCNDCYSKLIKEGQADPEMFEDINHPISQVIRHILNRKVFQTSTEILHNLKVYQYSLKYFLIIGGYNL